MLVAEAKEAIQVEVIHLRWGPWQMRQRRVPLKRQQANLTPQAFDQAIKALDRTVHCVAAGNLLSWHGHTSNICLGWQAQVNRIQSSPALSHLVGIRRAHAAVHLNPGVRPLLIAHLAQLADLLHLVLDELLATKAGVDCRQSGRARESASCPVQH